MAQDEFLYRSTVKQYQTLQAGRDEAVANLSNARRCGDEETAAENISYIAEIDARIRDLNDLCNRHIASQTPPPPPTLEERRAKPWEKMDYSDVWEMSKSKYGPPDEASFRAGIAEAQRRRQRGE
jgi:hypothetical protein